MASSKLFDPSRQARNSRGSVRRDETNAVRSPQLWNPGHSVSVRLFLFDDDLNARSLFCISGNLRGAVVSHFRVEDVPATVNCLDNLLRLIAERMPNIFQALHQRIIGYCHANPDRMNQFIFADKSPIVFDQVSQDLKRLGAQFYLFVTVQQTTARQVEHELVKTMCLVG